jgi:hypothetical protein
MQNDEIVTPEVTTDEVQVEIPENQEAEVEETPAEETKEETPEETPEEKLVKAENEAAKYRRLYEKSQKPVAKAKAPQQTSSSVEETVLMAQGMDEGLLNELKAVAQVRKTTLIKAQNDPIFIAVKEKFEKDKKQKDASLPASRGSGGVKAKKSVSSSGLSREEHKKLAMESMQ